MVKKKIAKKVEAATHYSILELHNFHIILKRKSIGYIIKQILYAYPFSLRTVFHSATPREISLYP